MESVSTIEEWKRLLETKLKDFDKELEVLKQDPVKNKDKIYLKEQMIKQYSYYANQK